MMRWNAPSTCQQLSPLPWYLSYEMVVIGISWLSRLRFVPALPIRWLSKRASNQRKQLEHSAMASDDGPVHRKAHDDTPLSGSSPLPNFISYDRAPEVDQSKVEQAMSQCLDACGRELAKLRVGQACPTLLDSIRVRLPNGSMAPISAVGSVMTKDKSNLMINLWDPSMAKSLISSIHTANLDLTVSSSENSDRIVVSVPKVTRESREKMTKVAMAMGESTKRKLRDLRQKVLDSCKLAIKETDTRRRNEAELQKAYERFAKKVDELIKSKSTELLANDEKRQSAWRRMVEVEEEVVKKINTLLAQTGERDRLRKSLQSKLTLCGWDEQVKLECQNEIKLRGVDGLSPQELTDLVIPRVKDSIPEQVETEMLNEIRQFLTQNLR